MRELRYVDNKGLEWGVYSISFDSPDGVFTAELWAISHEHAELQLQALKETGRVDGRIEEEFKA